MICFDITAPPSGYIDNPYPWYAQLRKDAPVHKQPDGSYVISTYAELEQIYRDTKTYASDKQLVFKPRFGDSPLFEHHTTSLVFNDPPLHTRVRKIIVGALTPRAIARMEAGLIQLIDHLLDELTHTSESTKSTKFTTGSIDLIEHFASQIPINIIGNLFDMPIADRGPLREWSLAILGALEPTLTEQQLQQGNEAVTAFADYLRDLAQHRRKHPGDPETDVLTRLMQNDIGTLSEIELVQNCIFILNAGHETTTNLIGNSLASLHANPEARQSLINNPSLITTAVDEFLRFESPNQFGNRLTATDVTLAGVAIAAGTNLHLCMGAANRDESVFDDAETLQLSRKPNRHLAFAGGPHSCIGLNLARMEGRVAIGRFLARFPHFQITEQIRSPRLRFRGHTLLRATLEG